MKNFDPKKYFGNPWNANCHETVSIKTDVVEKCFRFNIS